MKLSDLPSGAEHHALAVRTGTDLPSLWREHQHRNRELVTDFPQADAAVVEMLFRASGDRKRRLKRRLENHAFQARSSTAQVIMTRAAVPFHWLTYHSVLAELLAKDSGAMLDDWRLLQRPWHDFR